MIWSIHIAKIFYTDIQEYKIRPVYLFKSYLDNDYLYLPLSTNLKRDWIIIWNNDLKSWNLKKDSVVVIPKIGLIHKSLLMKEIAHLDYKKEITINKKLCSKL